MERKFKVTFSKTNSFTTVSGFDELHIEVKNFYSGRSSKVPTIEWLESFFDNRRKLDLEFAGSFFTAVEQLKANPVKSNEGQLKRTKEVKSVAKKSPKRKGSK